MPRVLFRLVDANPPTLKDFMSYRALGKPLGNEANRDIREGISVQHALAQARNRSKLLRGKTHVAVLEIPEDSPVRCERTGDHCGYFTLWGEPQLPLSDVRDVIKLDASRGVRMKPRFELWDTDSADLLGSYESIPEVLSDLNKAFPTPQSKLHIHDLVLTLELGGDGDDTMILLSGPDLHRLTRPLPASEAVAS